MSSMRGLTVFISDLRNCRARELEEKRINKEMANIRSKFKDSNLNGYQKRKYVCKLLYIYILGWDVDFGHLEAVSLISSPKYTEKSVGYLAISLFLTENNDLIRLVVNSIKKDLDDLNEVNNCLALCAIANNGGKEMAEALSTDVQRLLVSSNSKSFVKKKAALCLLRIFRKYPEVVPATEWAQRILNIMDDFDLGVALAVASLVTALAQQYPDEYKGCVSKAVNRLARIVMDKDFPPDHIYYKVPNPWLQVKLLRLLQYYPPPEDSSVRGKLNSVLQTIVNSSQDVPKNVQHSNAQNAIFFEAANLAISMDPDSHLVGQVAGLLGRFISAKETNARYLGLETMAHLASCITSLEPIKKHQETVIQSLRDKDISVRRRALDLLYTMCDTENAKAIVGELLHYLGISDYAIREELVLKIAILAEKFATDFSWFVDVILQLITIAGDYVSEEVWYRVVQIVTNNPDLQEYAARTILNNLKSPACHETALKVGGYILGEFGHLIANEQGCSPIDQFNAINTKFGMCSLPTRALLLTTYVKFINLFPEIKDHVMRIIESHRHTLDAELQQRSCEYASIVKLPTDDLLQVVCEEMPPFPERESALLSRLQKKTTDTEDKRTWNIAQGRDSRKAAGKDHRKDALRERIEAAANLAASAVQASNTLATGPTPQARATASLNGQVNLLDNDLLGLGNSSNSVINASPPVSGNNTFPTPDANHARLLTVNDGVLYEDDILQIGLKSEYHGAAGRIALYFGNKTRKQINNFTTALRASPNTRLSPAGPVPLTLGPGIQISQVINVECLGDFREPPLLRVTLDIPGADFAPPRQEAHVLKLPVALNKFCEPAVLSSQDFLARWKQIGGPPKESQTTFKGAIGKVSVTEAKLSLQGLRFALLDGVDPNPANSVGCAIVHTADAGKVGCLVRIECAVEQNMYRLTLRTTNEAVTETLRQLFYSRLTA